MNAADLLTRMAESYATARTYADRGVVTSIFIHTSDRRTIRKPFLTFFERPYRFRFEYRDEAGVDVVRRAAEGPALRHKGSGDDGKSDSLDMLLAALTGVSSGSSSTIPRMLLPHGVTGWGLSGLDRLMYVGEEALGDIRCHRLTGSYSRTTDPITVWLDIEHYLVRQIFERTRFGPSEQRRLAAINDARLKVAGIPDRLRPPVPKPSKAFDVEATTDYEPQRNVPIDPEVFSRIRPLL